MNPEHYLHHEAAVRALIAEAEVRGAVRALREAARALPGFDSIRTHGDAARWLRARAEWIEITR